MLRFVFGKNQYFDFRRQFAQAPRGLQPIHLGHANVHENYVGMKFDGLLNGFSPVGRLAANLPGGPEGQYAAYRVSQSLVIVNDQYAQSRHWGAVSLLDFRTYEQEQWLIGQRVGCYSVWNYRRWRIAGILVGSAE